MKELRLFFLLACICCFPELLAQKKVSGRSAPVQFRMMKATDSSKPRQTLKDNYAFSLQVDHLDSLSVQKPLRPYSVAIVIGVEQYDFMPTAPYAVHDAHLMANYFKTLLGVDKVITHTNEEVSGFFFENLFNAEEGELSRIIEKEKTDLYVYYSGHGMVSADGQEMFMLPVDCKMKLMEKQGYSLNVLFEELAKLQTHSTTVFIDACFSGLGKFSQSGRPLNLAGTKGVRVKPLFGQSWLKKPNFSVFTSCSGNQASLVLDDVRMGLFTYFLAVGLRGKADADQDGRISASELYMYIHSNVVENSKKIYQEQTPGFYGDGSFFIY